MCSTKYVTAKISWTEETPVSETELKEKSNADAKVDVLHEETFKVRLNYPDFIDVRLYVWLTSNELLEDKPMDSQLLREKLPALYEAILRKFGSALHGCEFIVKDLQYDKSFNVKTNKDYIYNVLIPELKEINVKQDNPIELDLSRIESYKGCVNYILLSAYQLLFDIYNKLGENTNDIIRAKARKMMDILVMHEVESIPEVEYTFYGYRDYGLYFYNEENYYFSEKFYKLALEYAEILDAEDDYTGYIDVFESHKNLADCLYYREDMSEENLEDAIKHYTIAIDIAGTKDFHRASVKGINKDVDDIKETLREIVELFPKYEKRLQKYIEDDED